MFEALRKRIEMSCAMGEVKARNGLPVVDEQRRNGVLQKVQNSELLELYQQIIRVSEDIQDLYVRYYRLKNKQLPDVQRMIMEIRSEINNCDSVIQRDLNK